MTNRGLAPCFFFAGHIVGLISLLRPIQGDASRACILLGVIGTLPLWPRYGNLSAHDLQRAVECAVLLVAALSLWPSAKRGVNSGVGASFPSPVLIVPSVILVVVSCCHARYTSAALQESALWVGLLAWGALFHRCVVRGQEACLLRTMVAVVALYTSLVFTLYMLSLASRELLDARALIFGFDNPRFLNHVQTVAIPLLWVTATSDRQRYWRRIAIAAAVLQVALAALMLARATFLAWVVALAAMNIVRERRVSRMGWLCLVAGLLCAVLAFIGLPAALELAWNPSFASSKELGAAHSRDRLWTIAIDQLLQSPWLGQGPMHFAAEPNPKAAHPHSLYLQLAAEVGLPAAALLICLLFAPLLQGLRRLRFADTCSPLLAGALAAALAATIDAGFSGNFVMPLSQLWIAAAWGMLTGSLATRAKTQYETTEPGRSISSRTVVALLLVTQLGLCTAVSIQALREPPRMRTESPTPTPGETYRPRFWLNGWI